MKARTIPFWLLVALWLVAFLVPFCFLRAMLPAAVLLGIGIPILWIWRMPSTCMNGGFGASLLAMGQMGLLLFWVVIGISRFLKS